MSAHRRWRTAVALAVCLALVAPGAGRAQTAEQPEARPVSTIQYFVRGAFFTSLLVIGFILVQALRAPAQDTPRLKATTDALLPRPGRGAGRLLARGLDLELRRVPDDTRKAAAPQRPLHPAAD